MDPVDQIPVGLFHVLEADIAQNAGVVDEDVDAAKGVNGRLDDGFSILDRVVIGNSLAACGFDLVNDDISGLKWSRQCVSMCRGDVGR
jgi:hypothetical protein